MRRDIAALGILEPTHEPRATDYVPQMLDLIGTLERKGLAYRADNGDVNFAVRKVPGYGKLSGKSLDELRAGERVAVLDGKHDPLDFVNMQVTDAPQNSHRTVPRAKMMATHANDQRGRVDWAVALDSDDEISNPAKKQRVHKQPHSMPSWATDMGAPWPMD
jgi:hypothetical protein